MDNEYWEEMDGAQESRELQKKMMMRLMQEEYQVEDVGFQHRCNPTNSKSLFLKSLAEVGEEGDYKYLINQKWWESWMVFVNFGGEENS